MQGFVLEIIQFDDSVGKHRAGERVEEVYRRGGVPCELDYREEDPKKWFLRGLRETDRSMLRRGAVSVPDSNIDILVSEWVHESCVS